ncbi:MAG: tetratricopeptide repeat protein, partial [Acidobacteria bacterium]|nr:tetratricopeptide repeat protein [Acidobacteriota bacterium]
RTYNLALALDLAERRDEAMRVLEELIARKPDLLAAYFRLAQLHRAAGNPDRAVEVLSRIPVGEASEAGEALYNVAVELYNDRHYDLALTALDRARDVRPDLALVDRLRGYVLIAQGHTAAGAQALRTFHRARSRRSACRPGSRTSRRGWRLDDRASRTDFRRNSSD